MSALAKIISPQIKNTHIVSDKSQKNTKTRQHNFPLIIHCPHSSVIHMEAVNIVGVLRFKRFVDELGRLVEKYEDINYPGMRTIRFMVACYGSCYWRVIEMFDDAALEGAKVALKEMDEKEKGEKAIKEALGPSI